MKKKNLRAFVRKTVAEVLHEFIDQLEEPPEEHTLSRASWVKCSEDEWVYTVDPVGWKGVGFMKFRRQDAQD